MWKVLDRNELSIIASPMRRRLLEALREPDSASSLARRLGMSRQRVGYHMRELERAGFLELSDERQQRGCTERLYRARPITYVFAPAGDLDERQRRGVQDRFSWASLINLAARVVRELVSLRTRADREGKHLATLAIETEIAFASPAQRKAFTAELTTTLEDLIGRYHAADAQAARRYRLFLGAYPSVGSEPQGSTS